MKGCQNARCNTKYIKKFVFEYQEVFFTHREPIVILKGSQPVFLLLSAWLNFNIPSEIELLHNDDSKSVKQILMFSSSQGTTKLVFHTVIWESECLGNWWLIYIVQQIVFLVIYLLLFTKRLPYLANPSWPWYLSSCLS